jgi:hypothetical protein
VAIPVVIGEASMDLFARSGDARMLLPASVFEMTKTSQSNLIMNSKISEPAAINKEATTIRKVS